MSACLPASLSSLHSQLLTNYCRLISLSCHMSSSYVCCVFYFIFPRASQCVIITVSGKIKSAIYIKRLYPRVRKTHLRQYIYTECIRNTKKFNWYAFFHRGCTYKRSTKSMLVGCDAVGERKHHRPGAWIRFATATHVGMYVYTLRAGRQSGLIGCNESRPVIGLLIGFIAPKI